MTSTAAVLTVCGAACALVARQCFHVGQEVTGNILLGLAVTCFVTALIAN